MQINRRVFSYPVLNSNPSLSSYNGKVFDLKFELIENNNNLILKNIHYICNSDYINKKIEDKLIDVYCIIECSDTIYRKKHILSNKEGLDLTICKSDLSDRTEISAYAVSKENIAFESTEEFDEDYQGIVFEIEKCNILCANDGYNFRVIHKQKEDNLAKSIFSIIPIDESDIKTFEVEVKTNKIEISMSKENYQHYGSVYSADILAEEFFCVLLVPALTEALYVCKEYANNSNAQDIDDIESQYKWFASISSAYRNVFGKELTIDEFRKISPVSLSQTLLGSPIQTALKTIENSQSPMNGGIDNE